MKDGTELTHYGVKGMKWGKRLFGKAKGVFGKPTAQQQAARDAAARNADQSRGERDPRDSRYNAGANFLPQRTAAQNKQRFIQDWYKEVNIANNPNHPSHVLMPDTKYRKEAQLKVKRNSKKINGR